WTESDQGEQHAQACPEGRTHERGKSRGTQEYALQLVCGGTPRSEECCVSPRRVGCGVGRQARQRKGQCDAREGKEDEENLAPGKVRCNWLQARAGVIG